MKNKGGSSKSMAEVAWVPISIAMIGVIGSLGVAWITAARTATEEIKPVKAAAIGSQSSGQKLCSAWRPYEFRDSMIVPQPWKAETCGQFKTAIGASVFQVGCVFDDKIIWGPEGGAAPTPNCGW